MGRRLDATRYASVQAMAILPQAIPPDSPDVLEKIVRELPALLAGMGRKVYVHAIPEPAMTMAMQRNGWRLEGLLPAAYHPEHCVVQWGLPLSTETTASSHAHDGSHERADGLCLTPPTYFISSEEVSEFQNRLIDACGPGV